MLTLRRRIAPTLVTLASTVCFAGCADSGDTGGGNPAGVFVTVVCEYDGASAEEIALQVSYPIESALVAAADVEKVSSASSPGRSVVWAKFSRGADLLKARQSVAGRLQEVRDLPRGAKVTLAPASSGKVLLIGLRPLKVPETEKDRKQQGAQWTAAAESSIRPRLLRIPGVSGVSVTGGLASRYEVVVSQMRLAAFNLTLSELAGAIEKANAPVGAGATAGDGEALIRGVGRLRSLDDVANTVIVARDGRPIHVKDVADVRMGWIDEGVLKEKENENRVASGFNGLVLAVELGPSGDASSVSKQIDDELQPFCDELPGGARIQRSLDRSLDALVKATVEKYNHALPPGWEYQRKSTMRLGGHLVAARKNPRGHQAVRPGFERVAQQGE